MPHPNSRYALLIAAGFAAAAMADDHNDHAHPEKPGHAEEAHADEVRLTDAAIRQSGVRVGQAEAIDLTATLAVPGRVAFDAEAMAHFGVPVAGRVSRVHVRLGDAVKAGDPLLTVESIDFGKAQSEYVQRRVEADVAAAMVAPAKDAYDRTRKLQEESQAVTLPELRRVEVEYRTAAGQAATSKAALTAARDQLKLLGFAEADFKRLENDGVVEPAYVVRAAISGRVVEREVTTGERVAPDADKLLVLADTARAWVLADVPAAQLPDVTMGGAAEITVAGGPAVRGEVTLIAPQADAATQTAQVRVVVPNADERLRPGLFAQVVLRGRGTAGTVAVPEGAVQTVEGQTSVFVPVPDEPGTFAPRRVRVGRAVNGYVPVIDGLKAGDAVVTAGAFVLKAELGKSEAGHAH